MTDTLNGSQLVTKGKAKKCSYCKTPGHNIRRCPTRLENFKAVRTEFSNDIERLEAEVRNLKEKIGSSEGMSKDKLRAFLSQIEKNDIEICFLRQTITALTTKMVVEGSLLAKGLPAAMGLLANLFAYLKWHSNKIPHADSVGGVLIVIAPGLVIFYLAVLCRRLIIRQTAPAKY